MPLFVRYEKSSSDAKRLLKRTDSPQMAEALRELSDSPAAIEAAMDEFLHNADDGKWLAIYSGRRLGPPDEDEEINFIPDAIISLQSFDQVLLQRKGVQNAQNAVYAQIMPLEENEHKNSGKNVQKHSDSEDVSQQPFTKEDKKLMLRRVWVPAVAGLVLLGVGVAYAAVQMNSSLQQNQYTMPPISQQASGSGSQSSGGTIGSMNNPSGSSSSSGGGGGSSSSSSSSSGSGSSSTQSATTQPASQPQSNSGSTQSSTPAPSNNSSSQSSSTTAPAASSVPSSSAPTSSNQSPLQSVDWSQIEANAAQGVFKVAGFTGITRMSYGSGYFVYKDYLLTDYHVVSNDHLLLHVDSPQGFVYLAHIVAYNKGYDLALLKVDFAGQQPIIDGANGIEIGEQLVYEGYALGKGLEISQPHKVTGIDETITTTTGDVQGEMTFTSGAEPGDSGGPVLDSNGHVLGSVDNSQTAVSPNTYGEQGVCGAVDISSIDSFLESALPNDESGLQQNGY